MKKLIALALLTAVQVASADTSKWVIDNLRTRSTLAVIAVNLKSINLNRSKLLTLEVKGIGGTDLSTNRFAAGFLAGVHAKLPFGFDAFAGAGYYCTALQRPTQALVVSIGKGF